MTDKPDPQKVRKNIDILLDRANIRQLRIFYLLLYEIVKRM